MSTHSPESFCHFAKVIDLIWEDLYSGKKVVLTYSPESFCHFAKVIDLIWGGFYSGKKAVMTHSPESLCNFVKVIYLILGVLFVIWEKGFYISDFSKATTLRLVKGLPIILYHTKK